MRTLAAVVGCSIVLALSGMSGCSSSNGSNFGVDGGDQGNSGNGSSGSSTPRFTSSGSGSGGGTGSSGTSSGGTGAPCPTGLACNVACPSGTTTTITGTVLDPAGKNPLYGITVYVPHGALQSLPRGIPTGTDACSCAALYKSGAVVSTTTDVRGQFTLKDAPVGTNVPLVLQAGKWRHVVTIPTVNQCADNPQGMLPLNGTVASGSDDSLPDIAVSTGRSDSLECLMKRIGLEDTEYVAGTGTGGHVHVYSGGNPAGGFILTNGTNVGFPEANPMPAAPESDTTLWNSASNLEAFDMLLLSCEGGETYKAQPGVLEEYLNAGGRVFASHFHYAWFSNHLVSGQGYSAPSDWGSNLATWQTNPGLDLGPDDGVIVQTLNGSTAPFPKGQFMAEWLANVSALGTDGVPTGDLSLWYPRYNAVVGQANAPSQPWITTVPPGDASVSGEHTMYFSFDTPVGATPSPDGGALAYCGRAVFSDLHVSDDPSNMDTTNSTDDTGTPNGQPPPAGCAATDLSPQEKVLEFMLFDLSSCVVPDDVNPPMSIPMSF
jgi:hypothetical protein